MKQIIAFLLIFCVFLGTSQVRSELISHWKFDDGGGSKAVSEINSPVADGILVGDPVFVNTALPNNIPANVTALSFDGIGDGVSTSLNGIISANARTISAWVKTTATAGVIVTWGDSWGGTSTYGHRFTLRLENGKLRAEVGGGWAVATTVLNDGQWHHVGLSTAQGQTDIGQVVFYLDGQIDAVMDSAGVAINSEVAVVSIGYISANNSQYLNGFLDDVRIYDTQLSQSEMQNLFVGSQDPMVFGLTPADNQEDVSLTPTLSWNYSNVDEPQFELFLGTDQSWEIADGYAVGGTSVQIPAGTFAQSTTYYWRVDMIDGDNRYSSDVWQFKTLSAGLVSQPVPADGAVIVATSQSLSFSCADVDVSFNIYFGCDDELKLAGNTTSKTIGLADICKALKLRCLDGSKTWQWRVDSCDSSGAVVRTGVVWDFSFEFGSDYWNFSLGGFSPWNVGPDDKICGDIDRDDTVDIDDVRILMGQWLEQSSLVSAEVVSEDALAIYYSFDGEPGGHHKFDGNSEMIIPAGDLASVTDSYTISFKVQSNELTDPALIAEAVLGGGIVDAFFGVIWDIDEAAGYQNKWTHFAFVCDGNELKIYCDGIEMASGLNNQTIDFSGDMILAYDIGYEVDGAFTVIDELKIYSQALTQGQIVGIAGISEVDQPSLSVADIDGDGDVGIGDFALVSSEWLESLVY
ncbi:MAG: LamG domain-containing protein [Phycisphaerae bacterium]|nr:LamG domain-containing protein [Phycisphaerae bacterium]